MIVKVKGQSSKDVHFVNPDLVTHLTQDRNGTEIHLVGGKTLYVEVEVHSVIHQLAQQPKPTTAQMRAAADIVGMND